MNTYTFRLDDWPFDIQADYEYIPASYGRREYGVPLEPDQPEHVDICELRVCVEGQCVPFCDPQTEANTADVILAEIRAVREAWGVGTRERRYG